MEIKKIVLDKIMELLNMSVKNNLKTKFIYKKIHSELLNTNSPILSKTQLKNIPNLGTKTYELLLTHINSYLEKTILTLEDLNNFKAFLKDESYNLIYNRISGFEKEVVQEDNTTIDSDIEVKIIDNKVGLIEDKKTQNRRKKTKKYIPGYRTGGYAILKSLWLEDGMSKHKIIHIAKNYCNSEFDLNLRNSAWSSIKTLIKKGLVYKETGGNKYFLTSEGRNTSDVLFRDTSLVNSETNNIHLVIDSREMKSRKCRSFFQNYFDEKKVLNCTRSLEVGDFVWIQNENLLSYIIERKCGSDFISSIIDGRFKEQKKRLLDTGIEHIFYIVEGLKQSHMKKINIDSANYCLTNTKLENIVVIETEDIRDTAEFIELVDKKIRQENEHQKIMSYGSFIEKGNKNKNTTVNTMLYYTFLSIHGITHEKAKILAAYFKTFKKFYELFVNGTIKEELTLISENYNVLNKKNILDIIELLCEE